MNCQEYLRRRSALPQQAARSLPPDMEEHLAQCEACARLESILQSSDNADPAVHEAVARIEALVLPELKPVQPLPSPSRRTFLLACIAVTVIAAIILRISAHGWDRMTSFQAWATFGTVAISMIMTASAVSTQMVPGAKQWIRPLPFMLAAVMSLPLVAVLLFPSVYDSHFAFNAIRCWLIGTACALVTAPLLWLVLRQGFPLAPRQLFALAGLFSGLAGIAVLELHCPLMNAMHKAVGHGAVAVTAALAGAAIAFRLRSERLGAK